MIYELYPFDFEHLKCCSNSGIPVTLYFLEFLRKKMSQNYFRICKITKVYIADVDCF